MLKNITQHEKERRLEDALTYLAKARTMLDQGGFGMLLMQIDSVSSNVRHELRQQEKDNGQD